MKVALLGLGNMGSGIGSSLLNAGFDLTVWNRTQAKMQPLVDRGAGAAEAPAQAAVDAAMQVCPAFTQATVPLGQTAGVAAALKLCLNYSVISVIELMGEVYACAEKAGIDGDLLAGLYESMFAHPVLKMYARKIHDREYDDGGFRMTGGLKDVRLMREAAESCGARFDIAGIIEAKMTSAVEQGMENRDWSAICEIKIPTIGVVNGPTAHSEMLLMCDITICTEDTVIFDPHYAGIGSVPGDGIHSCFHELLGVKRAAYALLTNQYIDAQKALEYGLVNEVLPRDRLMGRAYELADMIMKQPRTVRRLTTQVIRRPWKKRITDDLDGGFGIQMFAHLAKGRATHKEENIDLSDAPFDRNKGVRR